MSVHTTYDEMRDEIEEDLNRVLEKVVKMFDENIWGYKDMRKDYIIDVYIAVKSARDKI